MKAVPIRFRFVFGIGYALERRKKLAAGIDADNIQFHLLLQQCQRRFELAFAQQAVVDEDASLPITDGAMDQRRGDRRIDAT